MIFIFWASLKSSCISRNTMYMVVMTKICIIRLLIVVMNWWKHITLEVVVLQNVQVCLYSNIPRTVVHVHFHAIYYGRGVNCNDSNSILKKNDAWFLYLIQQMIWNWKEIPLKISKSCFLIHKGLDAMSKTVYKVLWSLNHAKHFQIKWTNPSACCWSSADI